jgi:3-vinyl bacteriochlorophyllide hydratase
MNQPRQARGPKRAPLYSPEERRRRDATAWTLVQGVLAPVQFAVCAVSAVLVVRYLVTGDGWLAASVSFLAKTALLYLIMITGSVWEKVVFGRWLFAPAFFWEDVVSMVVIALHTACLVAMATGWLTPRAQMLLALAAYASYVVNAVQFLLKLRAARLDERKSSPPVAGVPA